MLCVYIRRHDIVEKRRLEWYQIQLRCGWKKKISQYFYFTNGCFSFWHRSFHPAPTKRSAGSQRVKQFICVRLCPIWVLICVCMLPYLRENAIFCRTYILFICGYIWKRAQKGACCRKIRRFHVIFIPVDTGVRRAILGIK